MTTPFDDILQTLCSSVSLLSQNDSQLVFTLQSEKESQLAYDVLVAHGFDARIYHEPDKSKLYINEVAAPDATKLASALDHAHTLRNVLDTMEHSETAEYKVSFINNPDKSKQINIYFPASTPVSLQPATAAGQLAATPRPAAASAPSQTAYPPAARRGKTQRHKMMAGPAIAKKNQFAHEKRGFRAWLRNYIVSNFGESFLAFVVMIFAALIVISIIVASKGFMCPDLATVKSKEWYCNIL